MSSPFDPQKDSDHDRPESSDEKMRFSAGGNAHWIILRDKWGLAIDNAVLWLTGYSLVTKQYALANGVAYTPTLLLYTTGAKTGRPRKCGLPFFEVDGNYIVRGSNGGGPTDPHWVHNVRKSSDAKIRVRGRTHKVHAHVASGEERQVLFKKLDAISASTSGYQKMCAPRELPLVVLRKLT